MARSVNKVILIGRLGDDPEGKKLPNGNHVVNFSLATDEGYKNQSTQEKVDRTEWHRITAFGKLAEIMSSYLKKGSLVYIEGKLRTDSWVDEHQTTRYATKIIANEMNMLDTKSSDSSNNAPKNNANPAELRPAPSPDEFVEAKKQTSNYDSFDDDIPF